MPYVWDLSGNIVEYFGLSLDYYITRSLIFVSIDYVVEYVISLPFDLYNTFVIEEKHGFNKQTIGLFIKDQIKTILLMIILGYPIISLLLYIINVYLFYFNYRNLVLNLYFMYGCLH